MLAGLTQDAMSELKAACARSHMRTLVMLVGWVKGMEDTRAPGTSIPVRKYTWCWSGSVCTEGVKHAFNKFLSVI